jgi:hypothetical protein
MNMPRDIRHSTPAFEILRFVASVCLSRLSRQTRRDFSGYDIGKRRKVSVVPHIALDMAKELLRAVNIAHGDQPATPEEIASKIEAILLSIPEEQAFRLASIATEEREALKNDISDQVRDAILGAYAVKEIEREQEPPLAKETNGWMAHEGIKLFATRSGSRARPKIPGLHPDLVDMVYVPRRNRAFGTTRGSGAGEP